ncbi:MAG: HAD family phosphatase [Thermodesulfobacteriota bacterium]|nr:HAD family phosphatase [Thermodesulfobacteriota bacterium]
MNSSSKPCTVEAILFDFGGVLAEEGFRNGLFAIAGRNGLEPEGFAGAGFELVYDTGYVLGRSDEGTFWKALRERTHISDSDSTLRNDILSNFRLRPWMVDLVKKLKQNGMCLAILSDQTNWLDELNSRQGFSDGLTTSSTATIWAKARRRSQFLKTYYRTWGFRPAMHCLWMTMNPTLKGPTA